LKSDDNGEFKPIKITPGLSIEFADGKAVVLPARELDYEAILRTIDRVAWWINEHESHRRCADAERWLRAFEKQIPEPPPPSPDLTEEQLRTAELKLEALTSYWDALRKQKFPERRIAELMKKVVALIP
jgi:hypothetical protein